MYRARWSSVYGYFPNQNVTSKNFNTNIKDTK